MPRRDDDDDAIWVPVTINLPLGFTKSFSPENCAPLSLLCGPFTIILLAQTANTVLVPVLPFLVKDVGSDAVTYGLLQSTLWTSQTMLAPVLGYLSDKLGRRPVIFLSLLFSAAGNALLAVSESITLMIVARVISGLGFQSASTPATRPSHRISTAGSCSPHCLHPCAQSRSCVPTLRTLRQRRAARAASDSSV